MARSHIASLRLQTPKPCQNDLAPLPAVPEALKQKFDHEVTNASVVAIRPNTGEVLTMVGSLDYFDDAIDGQVNVSLASRQPGSSFKPYTYLTAFESGAFAPSSMAMDVRTVFPDPGNPPYVPENYDRKYHGPQTLRQALQRSYNIPAVWLMNQVGVANVIKTARRLGVSSLKNELNSYGLSLTLGGGEVALLDHTYAFGVLANGGVMAGQPVPADLQRPGYRKLDPVTILKVEDKDSKVLEQYTSPAVERVVEPGPAYLIDNVLSDPAPRVAAFGSYAQYLTLPNRPVAAKTGTTNSWLDAWTMGFTPQLAVGVWTGNSDNKPMKLADGSITAAPIFNKVLAKGVEGLPAQGWPVPPGITKARVCSPSGLLPTPDCPQTITDSFLIGHVPTQPDNMWEVVEINATNGKRASACTPPDQIKRQVYQVFPANSADWVREKGLPQPPTEEDGPCGGGELAGDVVIGSPTIGARVKGVVPITGNARAGDFRAYKLEVAPAQAPNQWQPIGAEHGEQISNGALENWDTAGFDGLYTLRLSVMENSGNVLTYDAPLAVDNRRPRSASSIRAKTSFTRWKTMNSSASPPMPKTTGKWIASSFIWMGRKWASPRSRRTATVGRSRWRTRRPNSARRSWRRAPSQTRMVQSSRKNTCRARPGSRRSPGRTVQRSSGWYNITMVVRRAHGWQGPVRVSYRLRESFRQGRQRGGKRKGADPGAA